MKSPPYSRSSNSTERDKPDCVVVGDSLLHSFPPAMPMPAICSCFQPESHGKALSDAVAELSFKKSQVDGRICKAESQGRAVPDGARLWVREVDDHLKKMERRNHDGAGCFASFTRSKAIKSVKDLVSKGGDFHLEEPEPPKCVAVGSSAHEVVGMEPYVKMVRDELIGDGAGVVGIFGMAGVGKTTLLRIINNTVLMENPQFQFVIWAEASVEFNLMKLQQDIAGRLNLGLPKYASSQTHAAAISSFLEEKSFVLLLDDLWETVDLEAVGVPVLPRKRSNYKQKVIFTTRFKDVCRNMGANRTVMLSCLGETAAWRLFKSQVGESTVFSRPHYRDVAYKLAKGCGGLPPALIIFGQFLSSKNNSFNWIEAVKKMSHSQFSYFQGIADPLFQSIKLTYDHLQSDTLRNCFLSCSLWPEGHEIEVDELIKCWLGLGYLDDFDDKSLLKGYTFINILQSVCLLEVGEGGDTNYVKMHCFIRHLALWIASDCGTKEGRWIVRAGLQLDGDSYGDNWTKAEQVSLINSNMVVLPSTQPKRPNLVSLTLQGNIRLTYIPFSFFPSMPTLVFLDLSKTSIQQVPIDIQMFKKLEHLNLSSTSIFSLPKELGRLESLKYLYLADTHSLSKIPPNIISKLPKLRLLDLYGSQYTYSELKDTCNSEDLITLSNGLKALGITIKTVSELQSLIKSTHLPLWRLIITHLVSSNHLHLSGTNLGGLEVLSIDNCKDLEELDCDQVGRTGHKSLLSLGRLKRLQLRFLPNLQKIWGSHMNLQMLLPSLRFLEIYQCDSLKNLSWVLQLRGIEEINVSDCVALESVVKDEAEAGGDSTPFYFLKRLRLKSLPNLCSICQRSIDSPFLLSLEVLKCPKLKKLPFNDIRHVKKCKIDTLLLESLENKRKRPTGLGEQGEEEGKDEGYIMSYQDEIQLEQGEDEEKDLDEGFISPLSTSDTDEELPSASSISCVYPNVEEQKGLEVTGDVKTIPEEQFQVSNIGSALSQVLRYVRRNDSGIIGIWCYSETGNPVLLQGLDHILLLEAEPEFSCVIKVTPVVSDPSVLQQVIAMKLGVPFKSQESIELRAAAIFSFLRNKDFVLLLENLREPIDLQAVGIPESHKSGSRTKEYKRIVVCTTTSASVCSRMGANLMLKVDSLLDGTLRSCVACLSCWPDSFIIEEHDLIGCWIGLGFIRHTPDMEDLYPIVDLAETFKFDDNKSKDPHLGALYTMGHVIIYTLQELGLLELRGQGFYQLKINNVPNGVRMWSGYKGEQNKRKRVLRPEGGLSELSVNKALRRTQVISLVDGHVKELPWYVDCPNLRILMLQENNFLTRIPYGFFDSTCHLTFLHLGGTQLERAPDSIRYLDNLQYLNLSHTPILHLPRWLEDLRSLKFLHLAFTKNLRREGSRIRRYLIPRLQLLDLYGSTYDGDLEDFNPPNRLKAVGITLRTESDLQGPPFRGSRKSVWRLCITELVGSTSLRFPWFSFINLKDLLIENCYTLKKLIMKPLMGPPLQFFRLKYLGLASLFKLEEINWDGVVIGHFLPRLRYLDIEGCFRLRNISWVLQLPSLEGLKLSDCHDMEELIASKDKEDERANAAHFPNLKTLSLSDMPKLRLICHGGIGFPSLVSVELYNCPNLKELPFKDTHSINITYAQPQPRKR